MRVAIVGTGIAGNVAAWHLNKNHDIVVYEAADYVGGHTNTVDVETSIGTVPVDTGFIVYNDRTYPRFIEILDELGVPTKKSDMSFSVTSGASGVEYCGTTLNGLFADRRNLFRPSFHRMIRDILRFNREAPRLLEMPAAAMTLGEFLRYHRYADEFVDHYLVPMGAAIWSAEPERLKDMPAQFFVRFFLNHGLLSLEDRPQWRVIRKGSREYVDALTRDHREHIRLKTAVKAIDRRPDRVIVTDAGGHADTFDAVFLACHSDQALAMLTDADQAERDILGAIRYQRNEAVLHSDRAAMPRRRRAWASWNYRLRPDGERATLTYHMNRLQSLHCAEQFYVTLNDTDSIRPADIVATFQYDHPVFTTEAIAAQQRKAEIDGHNRTYYCGAYWRYGFHEDGVISALSALNRFEQEQENAELHFQRAS